MSEVNFPSLAEAESGGAASATRCHLQSPACGAAVGNGDAASGEEEETGAESNDGLAPSVEAQSIDSRADDAVEHDELESAEDLVNICIRLLTSILKSLSFFRLCCA